MAKTTEKQVFADWTILVPGNYPTESGRYRIDRVMFDQSPSCEVGGCVDSAERAVSMANAEFSSANADYLNLWDLKNDRIIAKREFG